MEWERRMAELIGHMQIEFPDARDANNRLTQDKDYCVGGAFLMFLGIGNAATVGFPSSGQINSKLAELGVPNERINRRIELGDKSKAKGQPEAQSVGMAIIYNNDADDIPAAWEVLQEAFEDAPTAVKAAMSSHHCKYDPTKA